MRVLLVGNIYGSDYGANFYMIMQKFVHGFARNGHCVQPFNDRDVSRQSNIFRSRKMGVAAANRRLVETCRNFRPELLFLGHCDMIENATLEQVRRDVPDVRIAYRNVDSLHTPKNVESIHRRAPAVDAVFITTAGEALRQFSYPGVGIHFIPNPVDAAVDTLRGFARSDQRFDLFFGFGSQTGPDDGRVAVTRFLRERRPEIAFEVRGLEKPSLRGAAYFDLLSDSRMGLSFNRTNDNYLYSSDRMAQYTGNGLLTFMKRSTGFTDLYDESEIAFFDDFDELVDKVGYYKANDAARRTVAEAGWRKSHAMFDVGRIARYVEEVTFGKPFSQTYEWPTDDHCGGGSSQPR